MIHQKKHLCIMFLILIVCFIMAWIDGVLCSNYLIKSICKLFLFLIIPSGYYYYNQKITLSDLFRFSKQNMLFSLLLGIGVYFFIVGAYFTIGSYFDFSNVTITLESKIGVTKTNFIFVSLYISLINSFLEEFFFRGFAFLTLKKLTTKKVSYVFSAITFSLYHIAIMISWFTPLLFILLITSLFISGLLFNWLNEKSGTLYASWFVHICANLAINTIGFILFGIL
ncbi:CPBP family intramembrane glutamic endopeptidase [Anaerophilus nitritogenes]|uniref:CPBP family intramembrane glutamic endopeptidase n=1 Tax=Anaerophilus nitritogenes TaxID=2498136 RepID=UPI00101DA93A|nr:CPBP family intramembrane glutamic endopeptidase [Anaerophilus nitritogenes]